MSVDTSSLRPFRDGLPIALGDTGSVNCGLLEMFSSIGGVWENQKKWNYLQLPGLKMNILQFSTSFVVSI